MNANRGFGELCQTEFDCASQWKVPWQKFGSDSQHALCFGNQFVFVHMNAGRLDGWALLNCMLGVNFL